MEDTLKRLLDAELEAQSLVSEAQSIHDVERILEMKRMQVATDLLRYTRLNFGRPIAYLMTRERQLARIHAAIEGDRLGLPVELRRQAARLAKEATGGASTTG